MSLLSPLKGDGGLRMRNRRNPATLNSPVDCRNSRAAQIGRPNSRGKSSLSLRTETVSHSVIETQTLLSVP
ncbi:MAG: hypothetical protein Tsb009_23690 [Planctomycetaceae bacterium]